MTQVQDVIVALMDVLLGWSLHLPAGVALILVSVLSAVALTWARVLVTDHDMLRRCAADKKKLGRLIRQTKYNYRLDMVARKAKIKRFKLTKNLVALKTLKAEAKPLLVSLLPILLLATWAFARLAYLPAGEGEIVRVSAYFPLSAVNELAHIVPQEGLELGSEGGWIAEIKRDMDSIPDEHKPEDDFFSAWPSHSPMDAIDDGSAWARNAVAEWYLTGKATDEPYTLKVRWRDQTWEQPLRIGGTTYEPSITPQGDWPESTQVHLAQARLLGWVPAFGPFLPPWLVGYLLVVIPSVFGIKKLFNVR